MRLFTSSSPLATALDRSWIAGLRTWLAVILSAATGGACLLASPSQAPAVSSASHQPAASPSYTETVPSDDAGARLSFEMVGVPGGAFWMGSPENEPGRRSDEGPRHQVEIEPFWIGATEVTWDLFHLFMRDADEDDGDFVEPEGVDAVSRPTRPYVPMDFGMGVDGYPAISMTQFAARHFTKWLSTETGHFYRLPTEAEWEYACRAGTDTAFSFGRDPAVLDGYAWHAGNSDDAYRQVQQLAANPWGLYDLHGNVAEWTLDQYRERYDEGVAGTPEKSPVVWPTSEYSRVARGGSYQDASSELRCAARRASESSWKMSDPQFPQSIWYLTDAPFVGLRVVRPVREPTPEEKVRAWDPDLDATRRILERQRRDGH